MTKDLDALLTALYVYLDDHVLPSPGNRANAGQRRCSPTPNWSASPSPKSYCAATTNATGCAWPRA
ncbi:hypothetical protein RM446_23505, partial [Streptomonospora sp. DSM 45055]|nr:hypothetical protein [Streptomonospora sp. DSM 45055]